MGVIGQHICSIRQVIKFVSIEISLDNTHELHACTDTELLWCCSEPCQKFFSHALSTRLISVELDYEEDIIT